MSASTTKPLSVIYSPTYDCPEATDLPSTRKQAALWQKIQASDEGKNGSFRLVKGSPATPEQLSLAHSKEYIEAVLHGRPGYLAQSQGFQWSPKFSKSVFAVNGGHLAACKEALDGNISLHLASGAHHAQEEHGRGYCTFNYLVWCPLWLMEKEYGRIKRVLVVDLDAHQGDGTWAMTKWDDRFRSFDISACPMGVPPHHKEDGDYWLLDREDFGRKYFQCLYELPAVLDGFKPDLVEYQAGMDCHEGDPTMNGVGLNRAELVKRDRYVLEACGDRSIPVVVNLAGGYSDLETTVDLHYQTVLECLRQSKKWEWSRP